MPLGQYFWGSLYTRLDKCVANVTVDTTTWCHMDFAFLQMSMWELFGALALKPFWYFAKMVVSSTRTKNVYRARSLWQTCMKGSSGKFLTKVLDKEGNLKFSPYVFVLTKIHMVQIFDEVS